MKKIFLLLLAAAFAANAVAQSGRRVTKPPPMPPEPSIQAPSAPEPETSRSSTAELGSLPESLLNRQLKSLDKGSFRLVDFAGKVIVVNLWATWCGPCRMEVPEYEQVRKRYAGRGVEFIALTTEDPRMASDRVRQFVRDFNFGFRLGWADRETAQTLMNGRSVIPQTLVIATDGRVIGHWRGYSRGRSGGHLREMIELALSETSTTR
ncbi:MAG TPA: TlpA disulfide reductase family protein [Pyrinomonadaceae bacterium]|jgi:thiol-disulfide isomerase/thioredoxin